MSGAPSVPATEGSKRSEPVLLANRALLVCLLLTMVGVGVVEVLWRDGPPGSKALAGQVLSAVLMALAFHRALRRLLCTDARWRGGLAPGTVLRAGVLDHLATLGLLVFGLSVLPRAAWGLPIGTPDHAGALDFVALAAATVLIAPLLEEVVFRGVMLRGYEAVRSVAFAALFTAVPFALMHGSVLTLAFIPSAWMMARVVQRTGSVWNAVALHVLYNATAMALPESLTGFLHPDFVRPSLTLGLTGLVAAVLAITVFARWFRPTASERVSPGGPLWSASLAVAFALLAVMLLVSTFWSDR